MTRISMLGFENGHKGILNGEAITNGAIAISSVSPATGTYCLDVSGTDYSNVRATIALPSNQTEIYLRAMIRPAGAPVNNAYVFLRIMDDIGTSHLHFMIGTDLKLRAYRSASTLLGTGSVLPVAYTRLELHCTIDDANGICLVRLNGVNDINYVGDTRNGGNANIRNIGLECTTTAPGPWSGLKFDDFAVNNPSGLVNNSWPGASGIHGLLPNAIGTYTQLARGGVDTGDNYKQVNILPPADASYVKESTVDKKDSYGLGNTTVAGLVRAIQWEARAAQDVAGTANIARLLIVNGVDRQGSDVLIDPTFKYYTEILETKPVVGGAFSTGELDSMEAGEVVR